MYLTINTRPVKAIKEHKLRKSFKISRFYWRYLQNTNGLLAIVHLPLLRPCPEPVQSWDSLPEAWPCLGHQIKQGNSQVRVEQPRRKSAFIVCNINNRFKRLKWGGVFSLIYNSCQVSSTGFVMAVFTEMRKHRSGPIPIFLLRPVCAFTVADVAASSRRWQSFLTQTRYLSNTRWLLLYRGHFHMHGSTTAMLSVHPLNQTPKCWNASVGNERERKKMVWFCLELYFVLITFKYCF